MNNWQRIFSNSEPHKAELVKSILESSGLRPVLVNKKDSSYNNFGFFEIYVSPADVLLALRIIDENIDLK